MMRGVSHIYLYDEDQKIFGMGPCKLLHAIEKTGSLRKAAASMELSYSKAIHMIHRAEDALGFPLTEKTIGGKGGGGSRLTEEAIEFLQRFEAYEEACHEAARKLYDQFFSE